MIDLSDIKLTSTPAHRVSLMDHSRLGGPMGSETTSVIQDWSFANLGVAKAFAKLLIERAHGKSRDEQDRAARDVKVLFDRFDQNSKDAGVDLGAYGVYINTHEASITDFSFEREKVTSERVSAVAL